MYPVTKAVAEQFKTNAKQNLSLLVNPVVGESFELTSADILSAGLNINRYSATGDSVALGVCSAADLSLRVENGDGRFNDVVFEGAQIYASVGVEDGNNTQWVPLGYFTVDNAPRRLAVISITALDGMVQFDKLANRSALSLPNSVKNIVLACCNECNITIDTDLDALPNSSFVAQSVGDSEDLTYRTILQWCCQVMGVNGYMDWDGHLELSWYKKDGIPETVSGAVATFESVTEVPVSQLVLNIVPKQSFNGYDHPWAGGMGENLYPNCVISGSTAGGLEITHNAVAETYTVSAGTITAYSQLISTDSFTLKAGTYYFSIINDVSGTGIYAQLRSTDGLTTYASSNNSFTLASDTEVKSRIIANANATISSTATIKLEIVKGSTAPSAWAPYENICPITGSTEEIVRVTGKNIFYAGSRTNSGVTFSYDYETGVETMSGQATGTCYSSSDPNADRVMKYPFVPSGEYTWSITEGTTQTQPTLYVQKYINGSASLIGYYRKHTFSLDEPTQLYTRFRTTTSRNYGDGQEIYAQLEFGDTATEFEAPKRRYFDLVWDPSSVGHYINQSGVVLENASYHFTELIPTPNNGRYYYRFYNDSTTTTTQVHAYDADGNWLRSLAYQQTSADLWGGVMFYVTDDVKYIRINGKLGATKENLSLDFYVVSWQDEAGTVYGGTLDVVSGVLTATHAYRVMDGVTSSPVGKFTSVSSQTDRYEVMTSNITTIDGYGYVSGETYYVSDELLDKYGYWCSAAPCRREGLPTDTYVSSLYRSSSTNGTQIRMRFPLSSGIDTLAKANQWLADLNAAGTPFTVVTRLRTPQVFQLTPQEVLLFKGKNHIWAEDSTLSVTFPAVTEITPADRYNSDIYENAVTITGVSVKGKENQSVVGSEDYALAIDGNPLFTDDDVETIANGLSGLIGFSYHPFSASVLPMPYLYPLDMVAVQYKDEWYDCAITEINFTSTAPTQLKGTGESAQSRSYARINPLTNRERAIIENLKDEMNTTLNKAVNNIIDFNNIISNALGLYHTNVADGSGGFIRYLHDAPDLESSTYIVTETAQGFAWTTNGWNGGTPVWQYGVTSGGYALFKWLSAEGIDVTRASSDYRAEVTPEHFNIYYKSDLIITIDATDRAIQTPRMVIPYSSTSNNSLRVGQLVWLPTPNGANAVVLGS